MIPRDVLTLRGCADEVGYSYDWFQKNWRSIDGFPPPFLGGHPGGRPRWARAAVMEFKLGRRWARGAAAPVAPSAAHPAANDVVRAPVPDTVAALLTAAGG